MQKKKMLLTALLLLAAAAGLACLYRAFAPRAQAGWKTVDISIVHADGTRKDVSHRTEAEYLREALAEVADIGGTESEQFGFTLLTVDGETADFNSDGAYWAIYVGDEYGSCSLDRQSVEDGGRYAIVYTAY